MQEQIGIHCFVSGKVQGVWFRASTKTQAEKLNLNGFARNLPDGRVEVVAYGEKTAIEHLQSWLKQGPKLAKVTLVQCETIPWQAYKGFDVL